MSTRRFALGRLGCALALIMVLPGCSQYRQKALNVTPAPATSAACPDYSDGCGRTVWSFVWGLAHARQPDPAACGDAGLAEVTVRDQPHLLLLTIITLGLVSPKRVEWKCASPVTVGGDIGSG